MTSKFPLIISWAFRDPNANSLFDLATFRTTFHHRSAAPTWGSLPRASDLAFAPWSSVFGACRKVSFQSLNEFPHARGSELASSLN